VGRHRCRSHWTVGPLLLRPVRLGAVRSSTTAPPRATNRYGIETMRLTGGVGMPAGSFEAK
jgi:hypothetical protein